MSEKTANALYRTEKKVEEIEKFQKAKQFDYKSIPKFNYLNSDGAQLNMPREHPITLDQQSLSVKESMFVGVNSFNVSREMAALPSRFVQQDADRKSIGTNHSYYANNVAIDLNGLIKNESRLMNGSESDKKLYKDIDPHILRQNGKNILSRVDNEYQKILKNELSTNTSKDIRALLNYK